MIGVGVFFSDVHQPNKDGEQRHEEEDDERQFGNGVLHEDARPLHNGQNIIGGIEGHFVGQGTFNSVLLFGLVKGEQGVLFDHVHKKFHLVRKGIHALSLADAVKIMGRVCFHQRILVHSWF